MSATTAPATTSASDSSAFLAAQIAAHVGAALRSGSAACFDPMQGIINSDGRWSRESVLMYARYCEAARTGSDLTIEVPHLSLRGHVNDVFNSFHMGVLGDLSFILLRHENSEMRARAYAVLRAWLCWAQAVRTQAAMESTEPL